uniref:Uncharacterized protein n=1 Tax=Chromera velia CCMP2878 TaxID=1169474 RepID=A0A0G4GB82_9ALVE|eukprot:Cvel_21116.t1-p1 / transcript=Cvel_21116.t1 / gene=Cvel_21116 / organism=Chromera_velia_CCMP2878 / gene_product=hypothetical protein / transcript_product=hypothetical protein / location=Cvel_scaffold1954:9939-11756(-) / protein_length=606 / sequence_SO=supercontig / SO=protein_coding / is_pseudo=false
MRLTQHMTDLALFEAMETPHEAVKGKGKEGKGKALDMRRKQGSADGDVKGNRGVMSRLLALASALEAGPRGGSGTEGEGDSGSMVSALESAMAAALGPSGGVLSLTDSDSLHTGPEPDIVSVVSVAVSPSGSPKRDGKGKRPGRIVSAAAAVLGSVPSRQRSPKSPKNNASPQKVVRTTTTVISPPPLRFPPPPLLLPAPLPIRIPPTVSVTRVSPPPPPLLSPHTVTVTTPPPPPLRIIHTAPSVSVATPPRRVSAVSPPPPPPICISPGGFSPPPPPPLCILSPSVPQLSPASAAAPKETATQPAVSSTVRVSSPEPPRTVVRNNPAVFSFSSSNQPTFSPPVRVICSPPPVIYANPPPATSILTTPLVRPAPPPLISKTILCCTPPTATSPLLPQQLTPVTTIYEGPPQLTPVLRPHTPPAPCIQPLLSTTMPKSPVSPKSAAALLRERNLREREVALLKEVRRDHALLASAPQPTASDTAGPGPSSGTDSSCLSMRARATVTATASAVSVCLSRDDLERRRPPADSVRKSPKNRKGSPVMSLLREEVRGRTEGLPRAPLPMMPVESLERSLSMKPPGPGGPRKGKRHCRVVPGRKIGPTGRP